MSIQEHPRVASAGRGEEPRFPRRFDAPILVPAWRDPSRSAPTPGPTAEGQRWSLLRTAVVATGVALVVLELVLPAGVARDLVYLVALAGSALAAARGAPHNPLRTTAVLVAGGLAVSVVGDLVWQWSAWTSGASADASMADLFWLASYPFLGAALIRLLRTSGRIDRGAMVDVAVVFLVATLVQWELGVGEFLADGTTPLLDRLVWAVYPIFDGALLALVIRAVATRRLRGWLGLLIGGGITFWLLSDFAYAFVPVEGSFEVWLSAGWMVGGMLLAGATWVRTEVSSEPIDERFDVTLAGRGGMAFALVPMLVPGAIAVAGSLLGDPTDPIALYAVTVLLFALAYTRAAQILKDEAAARAAIRSQERYAQAIAMNSSDALALLDEVGMIRADAPQLAALTGHPGEPTLGRQVFELVDPLDRDECREVFQRCLREPGQRFEAELRVRHGEGHLIWLGARLVNLIDDPDVGGVVVHLHDISSRRWAEEELSHQVFHDGLTGLANRALFSDRVDHALDRDVRTGMDIAVIFLDLDGFKTVNDSLGHAAGDQLLQEVATRLEHSVRSGDTVARLGGDEFAILLEQSPDPVREAENVADRVLLGLVAPMVLDGQAVTVSASLGIATGDAESTSTSLLRDADVAMYRAKSAGRSRWVVYAPAMRSAAVERLRLESDLISALATDQFELYYQPVVELESEETVGFEALLRWNHPELGMIAPDRFIPIAEETGLIIPIGRWAMREACQRLATWQRRLPHLGHLSMAVNVSGRQLMADGLLGDVQTALTASGIAPQALVVEITETALIEDTAVAASRLVGLRSLGVRLAIDDFGTGYSSLSYLRQFPVDILKIDRSFVDTVVDPTETPAIVRGLLDLSRTLGLAIIAEGVEHEVQRDRLRDENCDMAQGFLFSRPLTAADAEVHLGRQVAQRPRVSAAPA